MCSAPRMEVSSKQIEICMPVGSLNGPMTCLSVSPCDRRDRMEDVQRLGEGEVSYQSPYISLGRVMRVPHKALCQR